MERIKLKKLLKKISVQAVKGSMEIEIQGISAHSKKIAPGYLFIAKKGMSHEGSHFISEAIANGAVAILTDIYDPFYPHVVQIIVSDVNLSEALIAKEYYGQVSDQLFIVGITGTNGKTTTAYLVYHLFRQLQEESGLIGTIDWIVGGGYSFASQQTTPDVITNHKLMHEMVMQKCKNCVYEVSSHALAQGRVASIEFDTAIFTNLTQDHLDYHQTMQEYASAKAKLFSFLNPNGIKPFQKTAVINNDSPYAEEMRRQCSAKIVTYGIDHPADLYASNIQLNASGVCFDVNFENETYPFSCSLIGRYNIYNILAAIGVGLSKAFDLKKILSALKNFSTVPGRLERVINDKQLNIFVDYAHTEDALCNVLNTLRELTSGRLITVFGCGGNRDASKRPKMGAVVNALSDLAIVTSDNPRHEDPEQIIREILTGMKEKAQVIVIPDRKEAIYRAVELATVNDIVLIAGKGHETHQIFSNETISFDDRAVARTAALQWSSEKFSYG